MPTFETPEPIAVTVELRSGDVRIVASDRADTVVEVRAGDRTDPAAVESAAATRIEFLDGRLLVKAPTQRGRGWKWALGLLAGSAAVEVVIALPGGSRVQAETGYGELRTEGRLGECRFRTSYGNIRVQRAGAVDLATSGGRVVVDHVAGHAEVATGTGDVRLDEVDGTAAIRNDYGRISVGRISGELRMSGSYGDLTVDRALAGVAARTAYGSVRIGEVVRGTVTLASTSGRLDVGIRQGTAAWLDVQSTSGTLRNSLPVRSDPDGFAETVEIRARTRDGDIVIHRS